MSGLMDVIRKAVEGGEVHPGQAVLIPLGPRDLGELLGMGHGDRPPRNARIVRRDGGLHFVMDHPESGKVERMLELREALNTTMLENQIAALELIRIGNPEGVTYLPNKTRTLLAECAKMVLEQYVAELKSFDLDSPAISGELGRADLNIRAGGREITDWFVRCMRPGATLLGCLRELMQEQKEMLRKAILDLKRKLLNLQDEAPKLQQELDALLPTIPQEFHHVAEVPEVSAPLDSVEALIQHDAECAEIARRVASQILREVEVLFPQLDPAAEECKRGSLRQIHTEAITEAQRIGKPGTVHTKVYASLSALKMRLNEIKAELEKARQAALPPALPPEPTPAGAPSRKAPPTKKPRQHPKRKPPKRKK